MAEAIKIPGSNSSPKYIEGIRVTYKAASGIFNYYDGERQDVESITGIIVGWGFQFDTTKGKPNKKKSASTVSNEFGFEVMNNNTLIKMRELVRENGEFSSTSIGSKTYKEWKELGHRLTKIVYIMDANDVNRIFKVQFSGLSFGEMNRLLKDDMPNYLTKMHASGEMKTTDNGDFFMPTLTRVGDAPDECYDGILKNVTMIYNILNSTNDDEGYETIPADNVTPAFADDTFGSDIP